jgi:hypothetical protein
MSSAAKENTPIDYPAEVSNDCSSEYLALDFGDGFLSPTDLVQGLRFT